MVAQQANDAAYSDVLHDLNSVCYDKGGALNVFYK